MLSKKSSFVTLDTMDKVRIFIRSLFNIRDFDMCSMLRKKCVFGTLSCIYRAATTLVSYARFFPHNEHIHIKIYIAPRREHRVKWRKRGCKTYPCRSLWRRVAITGSFIHCTPLTSSLGRSFTLLPSPGITRQPHDLFHRPSLFRPSSRYCFHPYLNDVTTTPPTRDEFSLFYLMREG